MNDKLQEALLRTVSAIIAAGVEQGEYLRNRADLLTNTHPTDDQKADFLIYGLIYCRAQSTNKKRSHIERGAFKNLADTFRREIKDLMI